MKIIGIVGSPHGLKGSTGRLMGVVLEAAREHGAEVESIALTGSSVLSCKACDMCHKKGLCPIDDDFESIKKKIMDSDGLVIASPNYIFNVSAQLKSFMDRCGGVLHCMSFDGKVGASVVTSGGGDEEPIAQYMNRFLTTTGIVPVGSVWATMGRIQGDEFPEEITAKARELGKQLVKQHGSNAMPPDVAELRAAFKQRMKYLMEFRKTDWPFEHAFWKEKHGL